MLEDVVEEEKNENVFIDALNFSPLMPKPNSDLAKTYFLHTIGKTVDHSKILSQRIRI